MNKRVETLIPTHSLRWFVDYDGERVLQQRFLTTGYQERWVRVPEVSYHDAVSPAPAHKEQAE